jgi:hypothetical protein
MTISDKVLDASYGIASNNNDWSSAITYGPMYSSYAF